MSMHRKDYINLGKNILGNVLENPTVVLQNVPQAHQTQATAAIGMLYSLLHIFGNMSQPQIQATPTAEAPTTN